MKPRGVAAAAALAAAALLGGDWFTGGLGTAGAPPSERHETAGAAELRYEWLDPNTEKVLEWRGDERVIDPSAPARRLGWLFGVKLPRLRDTVDAFGIPREWLKISYRTAEELERKRADGARRAAERGIDWDTRENSVGVAYDWVVAHSREDLKEASGGLLALARKEGYTGERDLVGLAASFVQGLEYRIPPAERQNSRGETVFTGGFSMPIEALYNGWGDCDTRCALLSSLLANLDGASSILLVSAEHAFVGVRGVPRPLDRYVDLNGLRYVLAELTDTWPLGRIPGDNWRALEQHQFRVVPLFDNAAR